MERGRRSEDDIEFEPGGGEELCCPEKRKLDLSRLGEGEDGSTLSWRCWDWVPISQSSVEIRHSKK